jgi:hypothetical protein
MTTTRINHTGHNHPNTPAARAKCRNDIRKSTAVVDAHYATHPVADSVHAPYRPMTPDLLGAVRTPVRQCSMCGNTDLEDVSGTYSVCCNKRVDY